MNRRRVSANDLEVVRRWREALSAPEPDRAALEALLAPDIEWVHPRGSASGRDNVLAMLERWSGPSEKEHLDVEFDPGELEDLGNGRVSALNHQIFRWKETGELAYERHARIDYIVRDGEITRYEAAIID